MQYEILTNLEIAARITRILDEAKKRVDFVSPYIATWGHLDKSLESTVKRGVEVNLFFRRDKLKDYSDVCKRWAKFGVKIHHINDLHAKIYANEKECLLTSMNLSNQSASNSEEVGFVSSDDHFMLDIRKVIDRLGKKSEPFKTKILDTVTTGVRTAVAGAKAIKKEIDKIKQDSAHCIRCGNAIEYNPDKPMCAKCYAKWALYKDEMYKEKYCHDCGRSFSTSMAKPVCKDCYRKSV